MDGNRTVCEFSHHTDSCRAVQFSEDAHYLFTGSLDMSMSMIDANTGQVALHLPAVHSAGISCIQTLSETLAASGDDDGCIKLWDLRSRTKVKEFKESEDFISGMLWAPDSHMLLATSGDGTLSVFDMNARDGPAMDTVSDYMEEELLSLEMCKGGSKVVCGTQEGVLCVFKWGEWADASDRVPGHPNSVETIVKLDEDTVITGSSDGLIRIMQLYPNKLLGVVGDHDEFPIEKIGISFDRQLLASCSHDSTVQFWDVGFLTVGGEDEDEDDGEGSSMAMDDAAGLNKSAANESFFDDL